MTVSPIKPYRLGGSVAAAANRVDRFRSPVALFGELTGVPEFQRPETEAMQWGKLCEPLILDVIAQQYELMPAPADGFQDPERPWLVGHPDAFMVYNGDLAIAEAKTHNRWVLNGGSIPLADEAQMQVYMHLTNTERALWACLIDGQRLDTQLIERDEHAIDLLLAGMEDFHRYLVRGEWPPPDGSTATRDALLLRFPQATEGKAVRLSGAELKVAQELKLIHETEDALKAQRLEKENILKDAMGDAELAIAPNDYDVCRWTNTTRTALDQKRLKAERPDLAEMFQTTTSTRRFSLL